jgi:hypothetical protein
VGELGTPPDPAGDAELARELQIVAMLRSRGAAFAPDPDAKARARQRLMAVLAAEQAGQRPDRRPDGPTASVPPPVAAERTLPMGRIEPPTVAAEETVQMAPVTAVGAAADGAAFESATTESAETEALAGEDTPTDATRAGRPGRRARHSKPSRPAGRSRASGRPGGPSLRRRATIVGAVALVTMMALAGGGVFASRDALPGDSLYAMKRAAESAGLALALDDAAKARQHLEIAATRLSEAEQLATRQGDVPADAVTSALEEFESATGEGSRLLLTTAESGSDPAAIDELHTWADKQATRLTELRPTLPSAADADVDSSLKLLDRLLGRTEALSDGASCGGASSGAVDDLGPIPTAGACAPSKSRSSTPDSEPDTTTDRDAAEEAPTSGPAAGNSRDDESDEPSGTPSETPDRDRQGLLPDLLPEATTPTSTPSNESSDDEGDSTSESEDGSDGSGGSDVPLPLLPPITLPPLMPGMPGFTIG